MTELKTLNDMESYEPENLIEEIKAEAVKEIKQFSKEFRDDLPFICTDEDVEGILKYIKWKNNITEKDLEEKEMTDKYFTTYCNKCKERTTHAKIKEKLICLRCANNKKSMEKKE